MWRVAWHGAFAVAALAASLWSDGSADGIASAAAVAGAAAAAAAALRSGGKGALAAGAIAAFPFGVLVAVASLAHPAQPHARLPALVPVAATAAAAWIAVAVLGQHVRDRRDRIEAWLAAGASPFEVMSMKRLPDVIAIVATVSIPFAASRWPVDWVSSLSAVAGAGASAFAARVLVVVREFRDGRLLERRPEESAAAFHLAPPDPNAPRPVVFETRPSDD